MPDITCPVCHTLNPSTRTFCIKCAADLHAVVPDPTTPPPPPKVVVPIRPLVIGGGVALVAIALIAVLVVLLGGTPASTVSPSAGASGAPSGATSSNGTGAAGSAAAPTPGPVTQAPATQAPQPTDPPAPTEPPDETFPAPEIVSFTGPPNVDCSTGDFDGFIMLSWEIENADSTTLAIDGPGIYNSYPGLRNSDLVPFSCGNQQHTYTLKTVGGFGSSASMTLTIVEVSGT